MPSRDQPPDPPRSLVRRDVSSTSSFAERARQVIATRRSARTREAYTEDLQRWLTFCGAMHVDPAMPPLLALTTFRDHLQATLASASVRRILAALSSTYSALQRLPGSGVTVNPFHPAMLPWPEAPAGGKTAAVSDTVAEAMIAVCTASPDRRTGLRDAAILRLLYDLGLRRSSVASMLCHNVRAEGERTLARVTVKGGAEEEVALPARTAAALMAWLTFAQPAVYVFTSAVDGPIHPNSINRIVAKRAEEAGVGHVHPHTFRAAFVTAGYDTGLPEREIQAAVHHSDPKVTRQYDRNQRGLGVADAIAVMREKKRP